MRLAILVSGNGSNLQAIIDAWQQDQLAVDWLGVLCNKAHAFALQRAQQAGLTCALIEHCKFENRSAFDRAVMRQLEVWQVDMIALAGFMRVLGSGITEHFLGKMLNIHPSLLPAYPGLNTHHRVLAAGERWHGSSVHFVTPQLDAGPVIMQAKLRVQANDNVSSLHARVQAAEHIIYPKVIGWLSTGRLRWCQQQAWLDDVALTTPKVWNADKLENTL